MDPLKMYFLLKMGKFHCYVSLPEGSMWPGVAPFCKISVLKSMECNDRTERPVKHPWNSEDATCQGVSGRFFSREKLVWKFFTGGDLIQNPQKFGSDVVLTWSVPVGSSLLKIFILNIFLAGKEGGGVFVSYNHTPHFFSVYRVYIYIWYYLV